MKVLTGLLTKLHVEVPECIINLQTKQCTTYITQLQMLPNLQTSTYLQKIPLTNSCNRHVSDTETLCHCVVWMTFHFVITTQ
jgi:hypothetical protein